MKAIKKCVHASSLSAGRAACQNSGSSHIGPSASAIRRPTTAQSSNSTRGERGNFRAELSWTLQIASTEEGGNCSKNSFIACSLFFVESRDAAAVQFRSRQRSAPKRFNAPPNRNWLFLAQCRSGRFRRREGAACFPGTFLLSALRHGTLRTDSPLLLCLPGNTGRRTSDDCPDLGIAAKVLRGESREVGLGSVLLDDVRRGSLRHAIAPRRSSSANTQVRQPPVMSMLLSDLLEF